MRTRASAALRAALAAAFLLAPAVALAQEEPELIPAQPEAPPAKPAIDSTPPASASGPLRPVLDFQRWREMTARERQTYVEGAVQSLAAMTQRLKSDLAVDGRVPPENLAAVVRIVYERYPKFPPADYLREMESIYRRADGQTLSMPECFDQAFRRINAR
ncbi:MAG TPA: hypothetical protein VJV75_06770 [Candidatus Polarisedimenticolia bacterium]|nr:hypothetical protein [Candidatus Polarisedimenticolia bacterium]